MNELSEQAKAAQRAYYKEWRAKNKDRVREKNRRYWEKRAAKVAEGGENETKNDRQGCTIPVAAARSSDYRFVCGFHSEWMQGRNDPTYQSGK